MISALTFRGRYAARNQLLTGNSHYGVVRSAPRDSQGQHLLVPVVCVSLTLVLTQLPPPQVIVSVFLPIGPCGQSAFAILQLASVLRKLQAETGVGLGGGGVFSLLQQEMMTAAISGLSTIVALVLTGFGWFWLILAVASILQMQMRGTLPFNMGWCVRVQISLFLFPVIVSRFDADCSRCTGGDSRFLVGLSLTGSMMRD